jgi:hypothetical protein
MRVLRPWQRSHAARSMKLACNSAPTSPPPALRPGAANVARPVTPACPSVVCLQYGWTALMWAVECKQSLMTRKLLAMGADPNAKDAEGLTALHTACMKGFSALAIALLDSGASPRAADLVRARTPTPHPPPPSSFPLSNTCRRPVLCLAVGKDGPDATPTITTSVLNITTNTNTASITATTTPLQYPHTSARTHAHTFRTHMHTFLYTHTPHHTPHTHTHTPISPSLLGGVSARVRMCFLVPQQGNTPTMLAAGRNMLRVLTVILTACPAAVDDANVVRSLACGLCARMNQRVPIPVAPPPSPLLLANIAVFLLVQNLFSR